MNTTAAVFYAPLFFIGFGIFIIFFIGDIYFSSRSMEEWSVVRGKITKSDILRGGKPLNPFKIFIPQIQYQYFVQGTEYIGTNITITGNRTYKSKTAQEWIAPYPVGKIVDVYYNPARHRMAVLEKGFSLGVMKEPLISAVLMIVLGIVLIIQNF
jgi:hypothetical protein